MDLQRGSIGWDKVGGLSGHVSAIKEMVLLPLTYPSLFSDMGLTPPRGVLFHGPPGTGKTLVARALAHSCSEAGGRPVSFFMRKGADILSKWVGEAEKQLRLLFEEASRQQPSIIFFDEIDGLAPVRSSKQDQIHASIVSTMLALMDGLDSRGQVILIGATNRIDALDPALRRPGRFDRELQFGLPAAAARESILRIHTSAWEPPPRPELLRELAARTYGYCGADLKALCAEAALRALREAYPQLFEDGGDKYELPEEQVSISREQLISAMRIITPAAQRSVSSAGAPLAAHLSPLLGPQLSRLLERLGGLFPPLADKDRPPSAFRAGAAALTTEVGGVCYPSVCRPHLLLHGAAGNGQQALLMAALHELEHCNVYSLELARLVADGSRSPQEACAHIFAEARRTCPAVIVLPAADAWLACADQLLFSTLASLLESLPAAAPLLLLGSASSPLEALDETVAQRLKALFPRERELVDRPPLAQRKEAFERLRDDVRRPPPAQGGGVLLAGGGGRPRRELRKAPPPPPPKPSAEELQARRAAEDSEMRRLRLELREICMKLGGDRRFREWSRPVDPQTEEGREFLALVGDDIMELASLLDKVNRREVTTASAFEACLQRIAVCAERFYGAQHEEEALRQIGRAHTLVDEGLEMLDNLSVELVHVNEQIAARRAAEASGAAADGGDEGGRATAAACASREEEGAAPAPATATAASRAARAHERSSRRDVLSQVQAPNGSGERPAARKEGSAPEVEAEAAAGAAAEPEPGAQGEGRSAKGDGSGSSGGADGGADGGAEGLSEVTGEATGGVTKKATKEVAEEVTGRVAKEVPREMVEAVGAHVEAPTLAVDEAPAPTVDETRLDALLSALLARSEGASLDEMERLLVALYGAVSRHLPSMDRTALLLELEEIASDETFC